MGVTQILAAVMAAAMMGGTMNINHKDLRTAVIRPDGGMDCTSVAAQVPASRASTMVNFEPRRGLNQKRHGWRQEARVQVPVYGEGDDAEVVVGYEYPPINGMWELRWVTNGVELRSLIVHAGQRLYRTPMQGEMLSGDMTLTELDASVVMPDEMSEGFISEGILYIFTGGGAYVVYPNVMGLAVMVSPLEEYGGVFVPTTTIGICDEGAEADSRESLDAVNLLTGKRKNRLILRDKAAGQSSYYAHVLDGVPDEGTDVNVEYTVLKITTSGGMVVTEEKTVRGRGETARGTAAGSQEYGKVWCSIYQTDESGAYMEQENQRVNIGYLREDRLYLYTELPAPDEDTGVSYSYPDNENSCTVTFTHTVSGAADKILKARFGVWFGENGSSWRLMLSGNPDEPNVIRYSGSTGERITDLTYWPDVNYISCGRRDTAITGFSRVSDGVMCAFKEENLTEPTIWYIQGTGAVDAETMTGVQVFTVTAGSIGDGIVSRRASCDLCGTPLVLTRHGVCAVAIRQNITTAERYLVDVGRNIRQRLLSYSEAELAGAYAFVTGQRYYLIIGDEAYLCEADRVFRDEAGNKSFEWWHYDHFPARCHALFGGVQYFGTADGRVCRMEWDGFSDETWERFRDGEMTFGDGGLLEAGDSIRQYLTDGATVVMDGNAYEAVLTQADVTVGGTYLHKILGMTELPEDRGDGIEVWSVLERVRIGDELEVEQDGEDNHLRLRVTDIDRGSGELEVESIGNAAWVPAEEFRLLRRIDGERLTVRTDEEAGTAWLVRSGGDLKAVPVTENLCDPQDTEHRIYGRFIHDEPVRAEYWSGCIDLGTNLYAKTILRMSAMTSPEAGGRFRFGYITARTDRLIGQAGISGQSFDADFGDFTFVDMASSMTVRTNVRNFNYIVLRVESDEPVNAALAELTLLYKYNRINRGGV